MNFDIEIWLRKADLGILVNQFESQILKNKKKYDPCPQNHNAEVTLKIFGQNSATPVIVGRGPVELREAKKTAAAQTSLKTTSCSLEVNEYTNPQSQK